jgi:glycosyltransferase involved in cell wall biosynthesis
MISAIIPAFNESAGIKEVLSELIAVLSSACNDNFEIIVVDDCSSDSTIKVVSDLSEPSVTLISNVMNMGYGFSLKTGIKAAKYDTIVILDADGTYPLDRLNELLNIYQKGFDLIVADRGSEFSEDSILKKVFRSFLRSIVEFTTGTKIPDVNSGLRIFSKETILPYLHLMSDRFSFTTSMTLLFSLDKKLIRFEPNGYRKRKGTSKVQLRRDIFRTLQIILELIALKNPLKLHLLVIAATALAWSVIILVVWVSQEVFPSVLVSALLITFFVQISIAAHAIQSKIHNRTS